MLSKLAALVLVLLVIGIFSNLSHSSTSRGIYGFGLIAGQTSAYENVTTHEGDLIIDGTGTFVIENCKYVQRGNICVRGYGKMKIYNSVFRMVQDYYAQFSFSVDEQASLEVVNSSIDDPKGFSFHCSGYSKINMNNSDLRRTCVLADGSASVYIQKSEVQQLANMDQSKLVISDSEILWSLRIILVDSLHVAQLEGLRPGFCSYWNLHENQTVINVRHDLTVMNSSVDSWSVEMDQDAKVTISNSIIARVGCSFHHSNVTVDGARTGSHGNYTLGKLTLLNSSVTSHWLLGFDNCEAEISNTTALVDLFERNSVSCRDSTLLWLQGLPGGVNQIQFQRTKIEMIECYFSSLYVQGEIEFPPEAYVSEWVSSNITRNYNVIAREINGEAAKNAKLTLLDKNDSLIWDGTTDSLGQADFNLTFADSNYTDTLRLEAFKEGWSAATDVAFLTGTPINLTLIPPKPPTATFYAPISWTGESITFNASASHAADGNITSYEWDFGDGNSTTVLTPTIEHAYSKTGKYNVTLNVTGTYGLFDTTSSIVTVTYDTDLNKDGKVNIQDMTIVAVAYGSKPEDPKWNPIADLDKNGIVNILDISMVARDYGKTV